MLVAEIQELDEVKGLVVKGQSDGVISYGEVANAVSEVDLDESDVEELYAYLERQGVELVEDVDPAQAAQDHGAGPEAGHDDRLPPALPQGHREGPPADCSGGGRSREAH